MKSKSPEHERNAALGRLLAQHEIKGGPTFKGLFELGKELGAERLSALMNELNVRDLEAQFPHSTRPGAIGAIYRAASHNSSARTAEVLGAPEGHLEDPAWRPMLEVTHPQLTHTDQLLGEAAPCQIWGEELIDPGAVTQMNVALRLSISTRGALMPDAHVGYGLPIGGVLETVNAVIPYAVGVDIGCSMMLTVLPDGFELSREQMADLLRRHTIFGAGRTGGLTEDVFEEDPGWNEVPPVVRNLQERAIRQLRTSGGGNHFVEFVRGERGQLAILSHSGSRGFGAQVAKHFTELAAAQRPHLPAEASRLAWLDTREEDGQNYILSIELSGRYALHNHAAIQGSILSSLGLDARALQRVSNSHNLAWVTERGGDSLVVHRKGATPADQGELGLIPGSMATPTYLVRGLGHEAALRSASHGAGRQLGRKAAERALKPADVDAYLAERRVWRLGGGIDEAPQAYKPIEQVIAAQRELVEPVERFFPLVVMMESDTSNHGGEFDGE